MTKPNLQRLAAAIVAGNFLVVGAPAFAQRQTTFLDLTVGAGYSTNPFLRSGDGRDSAFGRISAYGQHSWQNERGATSLSAFVENSTYLDDYDSKQIFDLGAHTTRRASETVTLYGSLNFSGDIGGQLSNRFVSVPTAPEVPDPTAPPPTTVVDPDLFAFSTRNYRLSGQAGASISLSERDTMTISGGAQRVWFTGDFVGTGAQDYTNLFASAAWDRQLSERTAAGFRLNVNRTDYDGSGDNHLVVNPELTARTQLSEDWDASGAVGLIFARTDRNGEGDWSTNVSLNGSLCKTAETERLCARVSRYSQNSAVQDLVVTTSVGFDWFKRLDEEQTIQLSASAARYSTEDIFGEDFDTTHLRAGANYDRRISDRLAGGATISARTLRQDGPDPDVDFSISAYLRYRIGDVR